MEVTVGLEQVVQVPSDMGASIPLVLELGASQEIKALCKLPARDHLETIEKIVLSIQGS